MSDVKVEILTEDKVVKDLIQFVQECDADNLANLYAEVFGGKMVAETDSRYTWFKREEE